MQGNAPEHTPEGAAVDGRRARRERGRIAVIDAMVALVQEGKMPPSAEMIAERAGVSLASLFRYFDGLGDLQVQAYARFRERFEPLFTVSADARRLPLAERIDAFVGARLDLYEQAGAVMMLGRLRSLEHEPLVAAAASMRGLLADQVRSLFGDAAPGTTPADVAGLAATIDALTSLDAWDVMRRTHGRSRRQIANAWRDAIAAIVAAAPPTRGTRR